jgi:Putative abortive phage resistance protein AbiGi, antitoxin
MLSSATLFHFTRSLDTLKHILGSYFKPFYSSEDLKMFGVSECPAIPMVSFCDIPLSQATKHVGDYGRYAIGLDKKWGMSRNISPGHYIYEGSICASVISHVYNSLPKEAFHANCRCMQFNPQTAIFFYGKPYNGHLLRKDFVTGAVVDRGEVTFYDEREWRYVPFADHAILGLESVPDDVRAMLSEREFAESSILNRTNAALHSHYRLTFEPHDARYVIVDSEDEIPELVDFINDAHSGCEDSALRNCPDNERKRLTTRVISMRQIEQDF